MGDMLRNSRDLREACILGVRVCLPPDLADKYVALLDGSVTSTIALPSPSTQTRARGRVDVAWMLMMREMLSTMLQDSGCVLYVQIDASPQGESLMYR